MKEGVLFSKDERILIHYPAAKQDKEYRIPDGTEYVVNGAIFEVDCIESAIIPRSMCYITDFNFYECKNLKKVIIYSDGAIGWGYVFKDCDALEKIFVKNASRFRGIKSDTYEICEIEE